MLKLQMIIPQDILEKIIDAVDIETLISMYESKTLNLITTNRNAIVRWENKVYKHYYDLHKVKLKASLDCLRFHVWDDGTPIKNQKRLYV
jgi:hypothetical protein